MVAKIINSSVIEDTQSPKFIYSNSPQARCTNRQNVGRHYAVHFLWKPRRKLSQTLNLG